MREQEMMQSVKIPAKAGVSLLPIVVVVFFGLVINGKTTLPVVDYSHIAQDAANEVVNFAKWAGSYASEAQTELNTLETYEQTVLSVARAGDPAALRSLPGIQNIATLEQINGQFGQDVADINQLANPANFKTNANQILSRYQLPAWNGVSNGSVQFLPLQSNYQFPTSSYNVAQTVQQKLQTLTSKLSTLTQQRDQALSSLQSATTTSAVQKFHAILDGLNGALADIHQQMTQVMNQGHLQQSQNSAAQQIAQQAQREQTGASFQQGINTTLDNLGRAGADFGATPRWGQP